MAISKTKHVINIAIMGSPHPVDSSQTQMSNTGGEGDVIIEDGVPFAYSNEVVPPPDSDQSLSFHTTPTIFYDGGYDANRRLRFLSDESFDVGYNSLGRLASGEALSSNHRQVYDTLRMCLGKNWNFALKYTEPGDSNIPQEVFGNSWHPLRVFYDKPLELVECGPPKEVRKGQINAELCNYNPDNDNEDQEDFYSDAYQNEGNYRLWGPYVDDKLAGPFYDTFYHHPRVPQTWADMGTITEEDIKIKCRVPKIDNMTGLEFLPLQEPTLAKWVTLMKTGMRGPDAIPSDIRWPPIVTTPTNQPAPGNRHSSGIIYDSYHKTPTPFTKHRFKNEIDIPELDAQYVHAYGNNSPILYADYETYYNERAKFERYKHFVFPFNQTYSNWVTDLDWVADERCRISIYSFMRMMTQPVFDLTNLYQTILPVTKSKVSEYPFLMLATMLGAMPKVQVGRIIKAPTSISEHGKQIADLDAFFEDYFLNWFRIVAAFLGSKAYMPGYFYYFDEDSENSYNFIGTGQGLAEGVGVGGEFQGGQWHPNAQVTKAALMGKPATLLSMKLSNIVIPPESYDTYKSVATPGIRNRFPYYCKLSFSTSRNEGTQIKDLINNEPKIRDFFVKKSAQANTRMIKFSTTDTQMIQCSEKPNDKRDYVLKKTSEGAARPCGTTKERYYGFYDEAKTSVSAGQTFSDENEQDLLQQETKTIFSFCNEISAWAHPEDLNKDYFGSTPLERKQIESYISVLSDKTVFMPSENSGEDQPLEGGVEGEGSYMAGQGPAYAGADIYPQIYAETFLAELGALYKDKRRSYQEILEGKEAYYETIFYRIQKYRKKAPTGPAVVAASKDNFMGNYYNNAVEYAKRFPPEDEWEPIQNIYVMDSPDLDIFEYVDTQLKYGRGFWGTSYKYDIYVNKIVLGSKYQYFWIDPQSASYNYAKNENCQFAADADVMGNEFWTKWFKNDMHTPYTSPGNSIEDYYDKEYRQYLFKGVSLAEDDEEYEFMANLAVRVMPDITMMEDLYFTTPEIIMLDRPPVRPDVNILPYVSTNNKIKIILDGVVDRYRDVPVIILDTDQEAFNLVKKAQISVDDKVEFGADSSLKVKYQVFRTTSKPATYKDFSLHPVFHDNASALGNAQGGNLVLEESILPNQKYYYTFRTIDPSGLISNPTHVYEVELIDEAGSVKPNIRAIDITPSVSHNKIIEAEKYVMIRPSNEQIYESGDSLDHMFLGSTDAEYGTEKKFKVRFTSKSTGKKMDINITFKKNINNV